MAHTTHVAARKVRTTSAKLASTRRASAACVARGQHGVPRRRALHACASIRAESHAIHPVSGTAPSPHRPGLVCVPAASKAHHLPLVVRTAASTRCQHRRAREWALSRSSAGVARRPTAPPPNGLQIVSGIVARRTRAWIAAAWPSPPPPCNRSRAPSCRA